MEILSFIITVVLVTASGALAPGPLFFANISHGTRSGAKGGAVLSIGHTLVEFPLVLLLALVFSQVATDIAGEPTVRLATSIVGGLVLLVFGAMQIYHFLTAKSDTSEYGGLTSRNPLLLGLIFTGLNPYFIFWWLTVGSRLVVDALAFASTLGVLLMYISHVWMDYAWLILVAHLAQAGRRIVGTTWYRAAMTLLGVLLVYFGTIFLHTGLTFLLSIL
ncbi:LysE family transporter [Candidatus Bathyarchaeota archaeon]|nr:LysE family transporter [Candidatus Bathyarchaeota archaeon]NIR12839.1 LysE family transporter [Desulfobacterales bacterium]NIU81039.1 LysE family transporter [Candidatus Bathyarchaeota archaeon]NIV67697.1 LysE family transporter [Candidatus Bathyarchaeota archaeon]NIW16695.1 LysE family transporter [Candidatus Bathyarchaeota archaeon]